MPKSDEELSETLPSRLRRVEVKRPSVPRTTFALRLDPEVVEELRRLAADRGIGPTQLVRAWVTERLAAERAGAPVDPVFADRVSAVIEQRYPRLAGLDASTTLP